MDYDKSYDNNFDCDPMDCNYTNPSEIPYDDRTEVATDNVTEMPVAPEEYTFPASSNATEREQAATDDYTNNFDDAYGNETVDEYCDRYEIEQNDYDTETATDDAYDNFDEEYAIESVDPADEQAATDDGNWYTTDNCGQTPAQERCSLDDYEIISDVLGSEKQIVKLYSTALCEAAEEPFRNIIKENLDEAAADQYKAFEFMQARGMYQTEQASEQDITKAKEQFTPLCNNCCCGNNDR